MYRSHEDPTLNLIPGSIPRYPYRKLNPKKSEFRLFLLYPRTSSRTEDLRITIFDDALDGQGEKKVNAFQALSYVTGGTLLLNSFYKVSLSPASYPSQSALRKLWSIILSATST
jgi:hypothetical protein